jgi:hypothetical protein
MGTSLSGTIITFALTSTLCNASLTEQKIGGSFETKSWLAVTGVEVTYETFDGTWVTGTFSGVLDPLVGGDAPVAIEGAFRGNVSLDQ